MRAGDHQPDRCFALKVARQAQRAAIEEVDQRRIAQHQQIGSPVSLFAGVHVGDARRDDGHGRHQQRIEVAQTRTHGSDPLPTLGLQRDVFGGRHHRAATHARRHARVVIGFSS